jgi:hypothetical protein
MPRRRAALVGLGGAAVVAALPTSSSAAGIGRVQEAIGPLRAVRGAGLVDLAIGDEVFLDDILRTGADGKALIVCDGGLEITLGPGTEFAMRRFVVDDSGRLAALFGLLHGIARLLGQLVAGSTVDINTRTAVASVRATEWLVESTDKGTAVLALSGEVAVRALAGGAVVVHPGEGTDVPPGGPPRVPTRWGEQRRRDALARTTI